MVIKRKEEQHIDIIWIFCEGRNNTTEHNYFTKLRSDKLRYNERAHMNIKKLGNTDPVGIVRDVINRIKRGDIQKEDLTYCVFDRDDNRNPQLKKAEKEAGDYKINIIFSNPCFEYWLLCHFEYFETNCEAEELKGKLTKHLKEEYRKNDEEIYDKTRDHIDEAIKNSKRIRKKHKDEGVELISRESNPSTQVFEVVEMVNEFNNQ